MSTQSRMLAGRLGRLEAIAAPEIAAVNMQVRTGLSVPFAAHMLSHGDGIAEPDVTGLDMQVRTGLSVQFAPYMAAGGRAEKPAADPVNLQVRTGLSVPFNPYMLGAHAEELLKKRIMISPVVVAWSYRVASAEDFAGWLATREVLLSESRMSGDNELKGVRYGGTYRLASDACADGAAFKTIWGYTTEMAMATMHRLCSDDSASATIVQLELIDFVKGLRKFIAEAGEAHFAEEVMISAAAGQA